MILDERRFRSRRSIPSLRLLLPLLALLTPLAGCAGRENVTKTERSAVEQALLSIDEPLADDLVAAGWTVRHSDQAFVILTP